MLKYTSDKMDNSQNRIKSRNKLLKSEHLGTSAKQKKRFNSGIAWISQTPPPPPNSGNFPHSFRVATIDETFSLGKKKSAKKFGQG